MSISLDGIGLVPAICAHDERMTEENARLRKLLDDAYLNLRNRDSTIEVMGLPMTDGQREVVARIEDGMSELGMEVIR